MAGRNTAVFGIYSSHQTLEWAVDALRNSGFRNTDISFLAAENVGSKDMIHRKATKAPEGSAVGGALGVVIGGAIGWLVGIGSIPIPALEPFVMVGPIMSMLAAAGLAGTTGGCMGALIGMGMPEYEVKRYEGRVRKGGILLSVHCDDSRWTRRAREVLGRTSAEDIASAPEATADFARSKRPIQRTASIDHDKLWKKRGV